MRLKWGLPSCPKQIGYRDPEDLFLMPAGSPDTVLQHYLEKVSKSPGIDDVDIGGLDFHHIARQLDA